MSDTRKQELLAEVAETINNHKMAREQTKSAITKAQKKSQVNPKKRVLISISIITTIISLGLLASSLHALNQENKELAANFEAANALMDNIKTVSIRYNNQPSPQDCQGLFVYLGEHAICTDMQGSI